MEKAKLEEFNHWWTSKKVDTELALPFKRDIYPEIEKHLDKRFILALVGLRRVGKTTIMYQLIQKLVEANIKKTYIFLDEIQKCEGWENELKKYYDLYPKLKFIISGSESLFIRKKTKETLAGRIFEFTLAPFTFMEYLRFNKVEENEFKYETKIKPFFNKFAEKGGFPETFSFETDKDFKEYIQSLSKQFEKDRRVIKNYINYLKESFLITLLGNYRKGSITTLRKKKRAYPTDNALTYLYKPKIEEDFFGRMIETIIVNKVKAACFWKNGNEVDIIYENMPIEVKYQEKINAEDFKPLRE